MRFQPTTDEMQEDSEMLSNLPEALEVHKKARLILTKMEISADEIDAQQD